MNIEDMQSLSHDLYLYQPIDLLTKDASSESRIEEMRQQDPRVNAACEKLRTSDAFLAIFEKHLESKWDINDDCSLDLTRAPASRNRQKRKAEASSDSSKGNIHIRRKGRKPPESKESVSMDSLLRQVLLPTILHPSAGLWCLAQVSFHPRVFGRRMLVRRQNDDIFK